MNPRTALNTILLAALGCGSRPNTVTTDPRLLSCPNQVHVTVSNRRPDDYDVYYQDPSRPATILGVVPRNTTVTFPVPGEGRGRVFLRGPGGSYVSERPGNPLRDIDIRMHCPA